MEAKDMILICKALSDTNRLEIVRMLSDGEKCGCKILDKFNITQPTLSHHMKILVDCGLVNDRKEGKWHHYSLNKKVIREADIFESYSAGTETKPQINQDAVRIMKEIYGIDMEANGQHSKLITDIPDVDIAISMGCNVGCPFIGRAFDDNWGLDDPTGKSDDDFKAVIQRIEENIMELTGICGTGNLDYMRRGE